MNKAEEVFRSFFEQPEDYTAFRLSKDMEIGSDESDPEGSFLVVIDHDMNALLPRIVEHMPSGFSVDDEGKPWILMIAWPLNETQDTVELRYMDGTVIRRAVDI